MPALISAASIESCFFYMTNQNHVLENHNYEVNKSIEILGLQSYDYNYGISFKEYFVLGVGFHRLLSKYRPII